MEGQLKVHVCVIDMALVDNLAEACNHPEMTAEQKVERIMSLIIHDAAKGGGERYVAKAGDLWLSGGKFTIHGVYDTQALDKSDEHRLIAECPAEADALLIVRALNMVAARV